MVKLAIIIIALFLCSPCYATQLYIENFSDQDADNLSSGELSATVNIRRAPATNATYDIDYEWATGRGGSGYALGDKAGGTGTSFLEFFPFSGTWPTDELYVSFWVRFADFTEVAGMENIKMFYARWNGANGYVHYTLAGGNTIYYSARANDGSTILEGGTYLATTGITNGNWHHLEFWVKFSTAQSRMWYDSTLMVDSNYADTTGGSATWTATPYWFRIPAEDAEDTDTFTRQVDDIEIYDAMPGEADTTPPTIAEVTPVTTPAVSTTVSYVFSSDEAGTITYGGSCGTGSLLIANSGNNTTTWSGMSAATYSNCTVTVTDVANNASDALSVTSFTIAPDNKTMTTGGSQTMTIGGGSQTLTW